ncbi:hypothetical protein [Paraburkholderia megapolitana]|uniref:hypothetical protein n=1 Tax=Paraburkholderia megapolitana TaxID=420953 RepID=UPI0038BD9AAE
MNELDFQEWISLAWILAAPLVINQLVKTGRSNRALIKVLTIAGAAYLLTVAGAMYLAYEAFNGNVGEASNRAILFIIVISPVWILISPFVIYRLFKIKRPEWAWVTVLTAIGAIMADCTILPAILQGLAETQVFRN